MFRIRQDDLKVLAATGAVGYLSAFLRLLSTALLVCGIPAIAASETRPQALVTITFDDASKSQYQNGLAIAKAHKLPGTIFVPTALVNGSLSEAQDAWLMNWDELKEFHEAGWEIGAHGRQPDASRKATQVHSVPIRG